MKKMTLKKDWQSVLTLKNITIGLCLCIFGYFILDFAMEFNLHLKFLKEDNESVIHEANDPAILQNDLITIKYIPSNKDLPECINSGEGFDNNTEYKLLNRINEERQAVGMRPLYFDINLERSARLRSYEMIGNNYMEHSRPNGDSWTTAITDDIGVSYYMFGENLARVSSANPERSLPKAGEWYQMWYDSETHYELMLNPSYTHAGIGIYTERTEHGFSCYATMHFANESRPPKDGEEVEVRVSGDNLS